MAKTFSFDVLKDEYASLWEGMETRSSWVPAIDRRARSILANKARYLSVQEKTGVPWPMIGVIHSMECGLSFKGHLHNGNPLTGRTYDVPAGRPKNGKPPFGWEESACDALLMKGLDKIKDWSPERLCYELERYNGFGYRQYHPSVKSPYLWSGTNQYAKGKYVADGKWSSAAVSGQTGAIPVLKRMAEIDASVTFDGAAPTSKKPTLQVEVPAPARKPVLPPADIIAASRKLTLLARVRNFIVFCFTSIAGLFTLDNANVAKDYIQNVKTLAFDNAIWILLVAGLLVWLVAKWLTRETIKDHEEGRYLPSGAA